MSHKHADVAAPKPGATIQLLAALLLLPAERTSVLDIAQEGEDLESQTSWKQVLVLGPAFTSGFPKEKPDQALEGM